MYFKCSHWQNTVNKSLRPLILRTASYATNLFPTNIKGCFGHFTVYSCGQVPGFQKNSFWYMYLSLYLDVGLNLNSFSNQIWKVQLRHYLIDKMQKTPSKLYLIFLQYFEFAFSRYVFRQRIISKVVSLAAF